MSIVVRPAGPADAAEVARLNLAFNGPGTTVEYITAHLAQPAPVERIFLAEVDGLAAGMAGLRLIPFALAPAPFAELTELFVDAPFRRRGVATALVRHIEGAARAGGARQLALITAWRNGEAHAFYHALGYRLWCLSMARDLG
jgi:GNAT superfamily N-acetyltransferase